MQNFHIRPEQNSDIPAIEALTKDAFATIEHSSHTEHLIINALRQAGALTLSLVAEQAGLVVGHVAISPVTFSDQTLNWYGLGPVSVSPAHQKQGIGQTLIREALNQLQAAGAQGCVVLGHPDYYPRFGFVNEPEIVFEGVDPHYFFALHWAGKKPAGTVTYHSAFES